MARRSNGPAAPAADVCELEFALRACAAPPLPGDAWLLAEWLAELAEELAEELCDAPPPEELCDALPEELPEEPLE